MATTSSRPRRGARILILIGSAAAALALCGTVSVGAASTVQLSRDLSLQHCNLQWGYSLDLYTNRVFYSGSTRCTDPSSLTYQARMYRLDPGAATQVDSAPDRACSACLSLGTGSDLVLTPGSYRARFDFSIRRNSTVPWMPTADGSCRVDYLQSPDLITCTKTMDLSV